ncbi:MFS transporter [Algoriphagus namhaensis]
MSLKNSPWYYLILLILSGEAIFILPFVLPRVFRPTVLETFRLDNVELGICFSFYGTVALLSYLFGGPLADRFAPRKLISIALWLTALGGLLLSTFPSYGILKALYAYWGFTTIFLFWAPMIKAARVWGGKKSQGKAFGFLDGGRGLVGALIGSLGVYVFSLYISGSPDESSFRQNKEAFQTVIWVSTMIVALIGVLVWFFLRTKEEDVESVSKKISTKELRRVLHLPAVWLLMLIILCAYVGYKVTDIFSLFAEDVMRYDSIQSAQLGTFLLVIRPVVGAIFGFLGDKSQVTFWLWVSFLLSALGSIVLASGLISESSVFLFFFSSLLVTTGVYASRALYYAVMEKGQIPLSLTGTAVGVVSLVGYTPDIFAGPLIGYLLEGSPGAAGHQHVFWMLLGFSLIGALAAGRYHRRFG